MFIGSAGRASWGEQAEGQRMFPQASSSTWGTDKDGSFPPQGLRQYRNAPVASSVVDQVVFGRDIDCSGDNPFADDAYTSMHEGAAGLASGTERPRGLSSVFRQKLQGRA